MARRDDGNEPIPTRPRRTLQEALLEKQRYGSSPSPTTQRDLVPPGGHPLAPVGTTPDSPGDPVILPPDNPAPPGYGNQLDFSAFVDICRYGIRPSLLNSILCRILQGHFARPENIWDPDVRPYQWCPSDPDTRIWITPNTGLNPVQSGKNPRLIVSRGPQQFDRIVLGDLSGTDPQGLREGRIGYVQMARGTSTIQVMGETDLQVERLANEVFQTFAWMGPEIIKRIPFHDFRAISLGENQILSGEGDKYAVLVGVSYVYEYAWSNLERAPLVQTLDLQVTAQLGT